jgi:hypothetical protein
VAQSILLYGQTGSFKTSNAGEFIDFLAVRYGGITRGIFGDNYAPIADRVESGWLDAWDITGEKDPLGCVILASEGWWPEKLVNGRPVTQKLVKDNFKDISGYLIEGFKENASLFMRLMERKRQATGEPLVGEHASTQYGQTVSYSVSSRGTYAFCQFQTHRYFKLGFKGLPVPWVMATTHEYKKKAEGIYGVAVAGKALAYEAPQWFDACLHFEKVQVAAQAAGVGGKMETIERDGSRAWFTSHLIDNIRWHAKLGATVRNLPAVYAKYPRGYIPLVVDMATGEYVSSVRSLLELIDPAPAPAGPADAEEKQNV